MARNQSRGGHDVLTHDDAALASFIDEAVILRDDFAPTDQLLTR